MPSAVQVVHRLHGEEQHEVSPGSLFGIGEAQVQLAAPLDDPFDQLLEKIIERCRELNLRLTESEESTKIDFMVFLTVQTMNYLHSGRHRVAL